MIKELISIQTPTVTLPMVQTFWTLPPADLNLTATEAHLWLARLDEENPYDLEQIISDDERARAGKFRFFRDKKHFIAARSNLRIILGKYLQTNPRKICFEYNEFGKPKISGEPEIKFNLSHSGGTALYAVTRNREIGVDIEQIKTSFLDEGMIYQCLTPQEKAHFQVLPKNKRDLFFFECWTRKEAFLKACGSGLSLPPNQVETFPFSDISLVSSEAGFESPPALWSFQTLPYIPDYAAALIVEGNNPRLRFWRQSSAS
jgi:4'-phosphopantetheinyl transferase